jgi:hypothetical protein
LQKTLLSCRKTSLVGAELVVLAVMPLVVVVAVR